ncbi:MAG TPA: PAS domain S-box protein [Xanthobacteraceae bacterium]|nr:PAS domain S-box protein [Xanthobacteraceae bacterium]
MSTEELAATRTPNLKPDLARLARTPAALRASPAFVEKLPLAVYACDAAGRLLWFNARAAELWGRTPLLGDDSERYCGSYRLYFDGRAIARDETPMAAVLRTGRPVHGVEGKVERPDGSSIWCMVHIEPVEGEDGGIVGAINCFHETTAQHEATERLREQDVRLRAAYERAGIGIAEVDAAGTLLRVNPRLCELMGFSPVGRSIFDETFAEDRATDRTQFRRQVAGEIDRYTIEKRIRRHDGNYVWVSITSSSVRDAQGRFLYAVRAQHDIDDRKRAEEQLARRMEELAALYRLSERVQHAAALEELYEPALDAITRALRCERASILLLDPSDTMRFVASRALSETYRRAVDGHSPWPVDVRDPEPIYLDDVERAELPEALRHTVRQEGIGALAFIPLTEERRLLGKFMVYFDAPHAFTDAEIDVALAIARHLGLAVARTRAETARRTTERAAQQLASIVESSDDAIISKDLDGVITTWNRGAERLFGYEAVEAIGQSITMLMPPDRRDEEPGILARIRRGEPIEHYETVRWRKDGSLIDISLSISPMRDAKGRIVGASKIARDITERKEAEAKLRDSERRLQDLLAAIPAAIYTTDARGRITYYNQAAVDLAGRTPMIGSDEWCVTWKLYRPDGTPLPHDECPMAVALKEGRAIRNAEAIAERPDGTRVPFIPYPTPLRDAAGNVVGAINMLVDVSERKQAETQQRILLNELNHRIKNNMQMLQSLLYSASRQTQSPEAKKVLAEASGRIAAIAAAQRVLYGTTNATQFSAEEFLAAVCHTAQQTVAPGIEIVREAASGELSNDAAVPLALILNELLTNAAKHGVGRGPGTIRVRLMREANAGLLCVEDDGPGFDLQAVRGRASGLRLVEGLSRQLRGRFEVTRAPSTRCTLRF